MRRLVVTTETRPLAGRFAISRGSRTAAEVVVVELAEGDAVGRGECMPYGRYGETVPGVVERIEELRGELERGLERAVLQSALPAGAARNAVDCALWDLEAKRSGVPAWQRAGLAPLRGVTTAYTLGLGGGGGPGAGARPRGARPPPP